MPNDALQQYLADPGQSTFSELVRRERDAVLGAAWRVLGDRALAEDVTQEVFMGVLEKRPQAGEIRSGRGWLIFRALGFARTRRRSEARRSAREAEHVREAQAELDSLEARELREAVFALPAELAECVELRYFGGLSAAEVSEQLGCARRTVSERLQTAREKLRTRLSGGAFGLVAPCISSDAAPPTITSSPEFADALDALAQTHFAGTAAVAFKGASAIVAAVLAVGALVGAGLVWGGSPQGALQGSEGVTAAMQSPGATPSATRPPEAEHEEQARDSLARTDAVDAGTSLEIHVVDEGGRLLDHGELELSPGLEFWNATDELSPAEAARLSPLLAVQDLESANPLVVTDLPEILVGKTCSATASTAGLSTSAPQDFVLTRGERTVIQLVVPMPAAVLVHVTDAATGKPVPDAIVIAPEERERRDLPQDGDLGPDGPGLARTDPGGYARLGGLGAGFHPVNVFADGYRLSERGWSREGKATLEIALEAIERPARVEVFVRSPEGVPMANMRVFSSHGAEPQRELRTDTTGRCTFVALDPGNYVIGLDIMDLLEQAGDAAKNGRNQAYTRTLELAADETCSIVLGYLEGHATWTVDLTDTEGEPIAGHEVSLFGPAYLQGETNADGRATFADMPGGEWSLSAGEVWTPGRVQLADEEVRHDVLVLGETTIAGQVTCAGGEASGVYVFLEGQEVSKFGFGRNAGRFELGTAPPGDFVLSAGARGCVTQRLPLTVVAGEELPFLEIDLEPGRRIELRLPAELVNPEFNLRGSGDREWAVSFDANVDRWKSAVLPPGGYTLVVRSASHDPITQLVRLGSEADVVVEIEAP